MREGWIVKRLYALSASAGSGKTFALVARYLALLFIGANPSEILAITFTNKAAGEMRERLLGALRSMPDDVAQEVAKMSGLQKEEIEKRRPDIFRKFLRSDLKVMTIDKFIHQILRKFCWYAGVGSDFVVEAMAKDEFFERFLQELPEGQYGDLVAFARFEAQKRQSIADFFELLYEKEKELPPLVHFEKEPYSEAEAMKWAMKIKEFVLNGNFSNTAKKQVDYENLSQVIEKGWFGRESFNYRTFSRGFDPVMDEWLHRLYRETARYYSRKELHYLQKMFALYNSYRASKIAHLKRTGKLHFKDIEHLVYDLLRQKDFTRFLYFRLDARIGHILFDEFQDTSVTQYRIFEPIIEEIAASESERSFFYVGDTKQSIYRFRGGQKALFSYVADRFGIEVGYLETNYRSRAVIVDFVNRTFTYVQPPQKPHKKGGYLDVLEAQEPLDAMGDAIEELIGAGAAQSQIAVLVHDNKEILKVGDYVMERFGWPIATHKRAKVSEQPSARALIALMRLVDALSNGEDGALHRLEFLTLAGEAYDPSFSPDIPNRLRPAQMLKIAMDRYGLQDEAAMKLLEFAIPLHDLEDFLFEVERYEEELPPKEVEGISVLTIHKSKGLEFEHLVVLDRLGRGKSDTNPVIFDYDGIELKAVRMNFKKREMVDEEFAEVLQKERRLRDEDAMNRIYVAFTRAKNSLHIVKKPKSSVFDFLDLPVQRVGKLEVERIGSKKNTNMEPAHFRYRDYGRQKAPAPIDSYEANDFLAIYMGLGVHYLLEMEDKDAFLNRYGALCDTSRAIALAEAGRENIAYKILTEGEKIHELPFVYHGKPGIVDLFVDRGDIGVVIDYKTSTPHDKKEYEEQLRRYKEALSALMPKKSRIDAYLYFLDTLDLAKVN